MLRCPAANIAASTGMPTIPLCGVRIKMDSFTTVIFPRSRCCYQVPNAATTPVTPCLRNTISRPSKYGVRRGSLRLQRIAFPDAIKRRFLSRRSRAGKLPIIAPCCSPPSSRGEAATKLDSLLEVAKYPAHVRMRVVQQVRT